MPGKDKFMEREGESNLFQRRRHRLQQFSRLTPRPWFMGLLLLFIGTGLLVMAGGIPRSMGAPVSTAVSVLPDEAMTAILETELPPRSYTGEKDSTEVFMERLFQVRWDDPKTWLHTALPRAAYDTRQQTETVFDSADRMSTEAPPPEALVRAMSTEDSDLPAAAQIPKGLTTGGKKVVFIYHTHNRESYLPELKGASANEAYDEKTNITLVGKWLAQELEKRGIGAEVSTVDYWRQLQGKYHLSYTASRKTVEAAVSNNRDLQYFLDVHRDALPREKTTRTIGGVDYAAIVFVVGKANKNWRQNEQFALKLHEALEKLYPGLSKGVTGKNTEGGRSNGEYNQSLHPNSILVEIGGYENTLEEARRSATALADALAAVYWDAEAVDAPADVERSNAGDENE